MAKLVRVLTACLYDNVWKAAGAIVSMDDNRAADLIAKGIVQDLERLNHTADTDANAAANAEFACLIDMNAAPVTLNLASLGSAGTARAGTTSFNYTHEILVSNLMEDTPADLIAGGAASTPHYPMFAAADDKAKIPRSTEWVFRTEAASGFAVAGNNNFKLDPGSGVGKVLVYIRGIASA